MEDRYLFRGKTKCIVGTYNFGKEDGEWVEGSLRCDCGKYTIFQFETDRADYIAYEVAPSTICQCIGHDDKNANLIFEYDIVKFKEHIGVVMWNEESASYCVKVPRYVFPYFFGTSCFADKLEIVGNKFDNPELLEVQK